MAEYIIDALDEDALKAYMATYDAVDEDGNIIVSGPTSDGGAYFVNVVGDVWTPTGEMVDGPLGPVPEMEKQPGYWARVRVNGSPDTPKQQPIPPEIIQYYFDAELEAWTLDGITPAPDFVQNVGVIA